jgi:tetratricopeptide (TPR) repeat protein
MTNSGTRPGPSFSAAAPDASRVDRAQRDRDELADCIVMLRGELASVAEGSDRERELLEDLAAALLDRHEEGYPPLGELPESDLDSAISYADRLLAGVSNGHRDRYLFTSAVAHYYRFLLSENLADLDATILHLSVITAGDNDDDPPVDVLAMLGNALAMRYDMVPAGAPTELSDLSEAIRVTAVVRDMLADDDPAKIACVDDLGALHFDRHLRQKRDGGHDLSSAIGCFRWLRFAAGRGDPVVAEATTRLGMALSERVLLHGNVPADVDEAIAALASAGRLLSPEDPRCPVAALYLGIMLGVRFTMHGGDSRDRAGAITKLRQTLAQADLDAEQVSLARVWLSQLLLLPFIPDGFAATTGVSVGVSAQWRKLDWSAAGQASALLSADRARADVQEAISHLVRLIEMSADAPEAFVAGSVLLGSALLIRGSGGMPADDLDRVIGCFGGAARRMARGDDGRPEVIAIHAWLLSERASRPGHEAEMAAATEALVSARDLLDSRHPLRPAIQYCLASMLGRDFARRPSAATGGAAIAALSEALGQMGEDHPLRTEALALLGAAFLSMAQFDLASLPIDQVVQMLSEAVARPGTDPVRQAIHLSCYGQALHLQAIRDHRHEGFAAGIAQLKQAAELLPDDHGLQGHVLLALASMLADQYSLTGDLEALEAAQYYLSKTDRLLREAGGPPFNPVATDLCSVWAVRGNVRLHLALRREDLPLVSAAITDLQSALDAYPPDFPLRSRVISDLNSARILQGILSRSAGDISASWPHVVAAAEELPAGSPDRAALLGRAGVICITQAWLTRDRRLFDKGIGFLTEVAGSAALSHLERSRLVWGLGHARVLRFGLSEDPADLDGGIAVLEEACRDLAAEPGSPVAGIVLATLAEAYRTRAELRGSGQRAAISAGLAALREQVGDVLLQTGTRRALTMTRVTSADAAEVAHWALDADLPASAIEALELGRGLVLHTATVVAGLSARLRALGYAALAQEWDSAIAGMAVSDVPPWDRDQLSPSGEWDDRQARIVASLAGPLPGPAVPSNLRHRVLVALEASVPDGGLLDPPAIPEITRALSATGRDGLAYLLPGGESRSGCALLITADGSADTVPLPGLDADAVRLIDRYAAAQQEALRDDGSERLQQRREARWTDSLRGLCEWAWAAAVGPLLERISVRQQEKPVQLVLIPCGKLAAVPWHAARARKASGRVHYAVEDCVFSYAASSGQFIETASRSRLSPEASPVFVADPVGEDIPWASLEARYIRSSYYPHSHYLGSRYPDLATPARVLQWMPASDSPGASMLHLSCHATAGASPEDSRLRLADDEPLLVSSILGQAQGRQADAPGGIVVLSACMSDLATRDYDEALTLATAFLAAGAVSVIGSRWQVGDVRTALLMFMFHHHLRRGEPPAFALRAAQLWMLDPKRITPPEMPTLLADEVTLHELGRESAWAAFAHQGQ